MFQCPHCHNDIEIAPREKTSWWKRDLFESVPTTNLGCGTLIIIAIIVAAFSNGGSKGEIRNLRKDIKRIEEKIDNLAAQPQVIPQAQ
ncbi:MAG: hypothetical protein IH899_04630 [Planctomycetes bacterium]|nr:hypothetical protein [Planctomycetota bacterium]